MGETAGIGVAATITNFDRYTYAAIGDNGYAAPPQETTKQGESGNTTSDVTSPGTTEQGEGGDDNINTAPPSYEDANADRSKEAQKLANTADKKHATLQQLVQNASGLRQGTNGDKDTDGKDI